MQNTADAEDVTQEVFIEIHRSIRDFGFRSSLFTWIYRITVNKCIDLLRKKKRIRASGLLSVVWGNEGEIEPEKAHFDHPGVLLERREDARLLFAAIETLPVKQKTAFLLFHAEEFSQKEIAEIMNTSPKAVESLIQRAKAGLRDKLTKYYEIKRRK